MTEIDVRHESGDAYAVKVSDERGSSVHRVTVPSSQLERYGRGADAEELLEESFHFLLEREPRSAILSQFELSTIESYFSEYPKEIGKRLG